MSSWVVGFASENGKEKRETGFMLEMMNHNIVPLPATINLSLPKETFLKAAVSLKNQVVRITWREAVPGRAFDPSVYSGLLGTAFMCLRAYEATGNQKDLLFSAEIIDACAAVARPSSRQVTFLRGKAGIYALGTVVTYLLGDHQKSDHYLHLFREVAKERALPIGAEEGGLGMSYDLLYGRTGFLWAALFVNEYLGEEAVPSEILIPIVDAVFAGGRAGASGISECPLMYRWHGTRYLGAANGLAGILHVLLHFPLSKEDAEDLKGTLRYLMSKRFPRSGNYPSSEGNTRDRLVQWCHGATGMAITLCRASKVFPSEMEFRDAAIEAGEVVWKSGSEKNIGLADGTAGNAYALLSLYRLTGDKLYEERAKAISSFIYRNAEHFLGDDDDAHSLFHGLAGLACLCFDLLAPEKSRFPGYEL